MDEEQKSRVLAIYIKKIVYNTKNSYYRKNLNNLEIDSSKEIEEYEDDTKLELIEVYDDKIVIDGTEVKLTNQEIQLIKMYFFEGYTEKEIARVFGVTRQAINKQKGKVISKIRREMNK